MFESGFLGTRALWFMDLVTVWFALLPLLMIYAIYLAKKAKIEKHKIVQSALFVLTIIAVLIFEVGVRISGGYLSYAKESDTPFLLLTVILVIHILIAILSVILWAYTLIVAHKELKATSAVNRSHKKHGKLVFVGMSITSFLGILIYLLLFM